MCQTFLEDIKSLPRESTATLILREITNNDTLRIEVNDSGTQMEIQGTQSDMEWEVEVIYFTTQYKAYVKGCLKYKDEDCIPFLKIICREEFLRMVEATSKIT